MIAIGILTGFLIGLVGVGGILLSALLHYGWDIDLHRAVATSSWSFLFTGITGTFAYARRKTIAWNMVVWLSLGIIPGALLGALTNRLIPVPTLTIILGGLIGFSGLNTLLKRGGNGDQKASKFPVPVLILMGITVGFGSALTGTGGPVLLVPILMLLHVPILLAIGVSQAAQLPIAIFASIAFAMNDQIDFRHGTALGIVQAISVLVGAAIAHRIATTTLRKTVAAALLAVAVLMIGRTVRSL